MVTPLQKAKANRAARTRVTKISTTQVVMTPDLRPYQLVRRTLVLTGFDFIFFTEQVTGQGRRPQKIKTILLNTTGQSGCRLRSSEAP